MEEQRRTTMIRNPKQTIEGRRNFLKATGLASAGVFAAATLGRAAAETADVVETAAAVDVTSLPRVKQTMVAPPFLPEHEQVATTGPRVIEVTLDIDERKMTIDKEGTEIWAFTYNGSVPGPMIVVHEGDYVELTLRNLSKNLLEHNIDFHAATGALGGGALTKVTPGQQAVLRWKASKP
ncbi:MAG: multicopper oxidase domain-containing protein, partial [Rhizobiales bacterium]|nr:multicopper oxidase domain-containing protein [Hyphomicrobiales bacterium]